eukprot:1339696-Pleurochrysis_carterae.AAC.1
MAPSSACARTSPPSPPRPSALPLSRDVSSELVGPRLERPSLATTSPPPPPPLPPPPLLPPPSPAAPSPPVARRLFLPRSAAILCCL